MFYLSARALGLHNYQWESISGERAAASACLKGKRQPVVFDIGANQGHWLAMVLQLAPEARVHAFEPQSALAKMIRQLAPSATVTEAAVGSSTGHLRLHDYAGREGSEHATLVEGVIENLHGAGSRSTRVPVLRIDDYCRDFGIDHIDLMNIDVEGFELNVMRGAESMIRDRKIDAIQFEFNEMNVLARTFMRDIESVLADGYRLFRVLPHGLMPLGRQSPWVKEQFIFQNVIALSLPRSVGQGG
jgi:FkbM family methyltransferase